MLQSNLHRNSFLNCFLQQGEFHWSPDVQGIILSAYFYGYLATEILGAYLAERFGGKIVFGAGLFVSAVFTLVTAPAARWSPYALMAVRYVDFLRQIYYFV